MNLNETLCESFFEAVFETLTPGNILCFDLQNHFINFLESREEDMGELEAIHWWLSMACDNIPEDDQLSELMKKFFYKRDQLMGILLVLEKLSGEIMES